MKLIFWYSYQKTQALKTKKPHIIDAASPPLVMPILSKIQYHYLALLSARIITQWYFKFL